jgi:hypothetical protein
MNLAAQDAVHRSCGIRFFLFFIHHLHRFSPHELTVQPAAALQLHLLEVVDWVFGASARAVAWGTGLSEVHRRGWLLCNHGSLHCVLQ